MEKIKKGITSISIRSSEFIFSLLASAEDFTIGQYSPWIIDTWNRKKIKPGFSRNCLGKSGESSPKSLSSAISYPPNLKFFMNSLLLLFYCCLVCSTFSIKQNQIGYFQGSHHTKNLGNLSLEPTGLCFLGLDYHSFNWISDYRQRGIQKSLGGHFKEVKICVQLMESKESTALFAATRKKYTPATGPHYYCMWEAIDGISNKKRSEPMDYRKGSLHHSWTDTRNHRAAGFSVGSKKKLIPSKYHKSNNRTKGSRYTLTFSTNEAEILWRSWSDRSKSISRVFLDRLKDIARKTVDEPLVCPTDSCKRRGGEAIKLKCTGVLERSETKGRKTYKGSFGILFDPGIDHALYLPEQKSSGWPVMCKRTLLDDSELGQLHTQPIEFLYVLDDGPDIKTSLPTEGAK